MDFESYANLSVSRALSCRLGAILFPFDFSSPPFPSRWVWTAGQKYMFQKKKRHKKKEKRQEKIEKRLKKKEKGQKKRRKKAKKKEKKKSLVQ